MKKYTVDEATKQLIQAFESGEDEGFEGVKAFLKYLIDCETVELTKVLVDIRHKTGIGEKPMLSELADTLKKEMRLQYCNGMFDAAESLAKQFEHEGFEARAADIRRKAYEWAGQFTVPAEALALVESNGNG